MPIIRLFDRKNGYYNVSANSFTEPQVTAKVRSDSKDVILNNVNKV